MVKIDSVIQNIEQQEQKAEWKTYPKSKRQFSEIENDILKLLNERNRNGKTTTKQQDFYSLVEEIKKSFQTEISRAFLIELLKAKEVLNPSIKISNFIRRNNINFSREVIKNIPSLKWRGYGEDAGFEIQKEGLKTFLFF